MAINDHLEAIDVDEKIETVLGYATIPVEMALQHPNCYALIADGDCMEPMIHNHDVMVIDPDITDGDIVAVEFEGIRHVCRLVRGNKTVHMCHENPKYQTVRAPIEAVKILGTVFCIISDQVTELEVAATNDRSEIGAQEA